MTAPESCAIMRKMTEKNLHHDLRSNLPTALVELIEAAGNLAEERGQNLYLVGGAVRDLILGEPVCDLDLVVEGDGVALARALAEITPAEITTHPHFGTAKLRRDEHSLDITSARRETYARPGALPTVEPGSLKDDLFRRDYTINAMALSLNPKGHGEVIDYYDGQTDLEQRHLRVLHDNSFIDDATRIWRGLRYEQRLGFTLEDNTRRLMARDIPILGTISGDRIRYELECIFREAQPENVISRGCEVGALQQINPALNGNGWLEEKYRALRQQCAPKTPPFDHYLALLAYNLSEEEGRQLAAFLKLPKSADKVIRDTITVKAKLKKIAAPTVKASYAYQLLHGVSPTAITVATLATSS